MLNRLLMFILILRFFFLKNSGDMPLVCVHGFKCQNLKEQDMSKVKGFTLIELVIVIAILGVLAAIAIPKFIDLNDDALLAAAKGMSGAVKSAHAIAIADIKDFPTVTALAGYVNGENIVAVGTGIQVDIDGTDYVVPTFSDPTCGTATILATEQVECVGTITIP
jgi:MSHA pilin protein MshA